MKRILVIALLLAFVGSAQAAQTLVYAEYGGSIYETTLSGTPISNFSASPTIGTAYGLGGMPNGDILLGQYGYNNTVAEYTLGGALVKNYGTAFATPIGMTADTSGNIFVADAQGHRFDMVTPGGVDTTLASTVISGGTNSYPASIAVNSATGDVYCSVGYQVHGSYDSGVILKTNESNFGTATQWFSHGTDQLGGVAVDAGGNVWVTDYDSHSIYKLDSSGNIIAGNTITVASNSAPAGIAFNAAGNLYVALNNAKKISEYSSTNGQFIKDVVTGLSNVANIAIVPEPATLVLLGLGALTLLRKKK